MFNFKKLILNELTLLQLRIQLEDCELSPEAAMEILSIIAHQSLSKVQACDILHISRSKFDRLISLGKLPPGRKTIGFNELVWYKDELLNSINNLKDE